MSKSKEGTYCYEYPRPAVTVDIVVVTRERHPRVLLIRRKAQPFAGVWAVPGGFIEIDEPLEAAARRELKEETGIAVERIEQLGAFGDPERDPRGRTISIAYLAQVDWTQVHPHADDDAAEVGWHLLSHPPPLAFDHEKILESARRFLN
jgi:8-oxo-dGTP diphosphatase